jgi:SsrA-binding protein
LTIDARIFHGEEHHDTISSLVNGWNNSVIRIEDGWPWKVLNSGPKEIVVMVKPSDSKPDYSLSRVVCRNRKAKHEYELSQSLECGIVLHGSEVKSIRNNKISIEEAWVRVQDHEVFLVGCDIAEYPQATYLNHDPKRQRKLLLHRSEIRKFAEVANQKGLSIVPLEVHLVRGNVKVTIAVGKGLKRHDKREKLKENDANREMRQAIRRQND